SDESGYRLRVIERQVLHQQYRADAGCGGDPEFRVEDACPAQAAGRALARIRVLAGDLKAERETVASRAKRESAREERRRLVLQRNAHVAELVLCKRAHRFTL